MMAMTIERLMRESGEAAGVELMRQQLRSGSVPLRSELVVTIKLTESPALESGWRGSFDEAERLIALALEQAPTRGAYHKTWFRLEAPGVDAYEGRLDLSPADRSLAEHVTTFCTNVLDLPEGNWQAPSADGALWLRWWRVAVSARCGELLLPPAEISERDWEASAGRKGMFAELRRAGLMLELSTMHTRGGHRCCFVLGLHSAIVSTLRRLALPGEVVAVAGAVSTVRVTLARRVGTRIVADGGE